MASHSLHVESSPCSDRCCREPRDGTGFFRSHSRWGGAHQSPVPSDPHLSTETGLVGAPIPGWPRQPRPKVSCKNPAWKHRADRASQCPSGAPGTGTPLEPCQKTQWWQARLAGADTAPGTGGDRFVRLPVLFGPCQNLKRRKWHQVHFTDKKTEVQGTKAGRGLCGAEPGFQPSSPPFRAQVWTGIRGTPPGVKRPTSRLQARPQSWLCQHLRLPWAGGGVKENAGPHLLPRAAQTPAPCWCPCLASQAPYPTPAAGWPTDGDWGHSETHSYTGLPVSTPTSAGLGWGQ